MVVRRALGVFSDLKNQPQNKNPEPTTELYTRVESIVSYQTFGEGSTDTISVLSGQQQPAYRQFYSTETAVTKMYGGDTL